MYRNTIELCSLEFGSPGSMKYRPLVPETPTEPRTLAGPPPHGQALCLKHSTDWQWQGGAVGFPVFANHTDLAAGFFPSLPSYSPSSGHSSSAKGPLANVNTGTRQKTARWSQADLGTKPAHGTCVQPPEPPFPHPGNKDHSSYPEGLCTDSKHSWTLK